MRKGRRKISQLCQVQCESLSYSSKRVYKTEEKLWTVVYLFPRVAFFNISDRKAQSILFCEPIKIFLKNETVI